MARRLAAFLALLLTALFPAGCEREKPVFKIAYMICNSLEESKGRFDPLTAYLSEAVGARFEAVYLDTVDFEEAYAKGGIDFTHTNSLLFHALEKRAGVGYLASEKRGAFGALTRGVIMVRADSPVRTLADLKGKRLVFGPNWAPFGFLAQYALFIENGFDPETFLGPYSFPGGAWKHEKIIYSVLYGASDAGAAPLIDLEEMAAEGKIAPGDFRVVAETGLAPYCTFGVSKKVDAEWAEKFREALLKLTPASTSSAGGEKLSVLKRAQVDGFEVLPPGAFAPIVKWAKMSRMPPYEDN